MNLDLTDSGQYTVTILTPEALFLDENTKLEVYGKMLCILLLSVNTFPSIFYSSVSLSCSSSGSPPLSYHWLNGSFVVTVSDGVQFGDGNSTLTIVSVTRYDKGPFSCSVSNPVSSDINRQNLTLTISYGPENAAMKVIPSDVHYETGSNLNLSCSAETSPPAQFQWSLNGTLLSNKGPELRLGNIQINQSGSYSCWAHNTRTLRYQTSEPSDITVLGKWQRGNGDNHGRRESNWFNSVNLTCDAAGSIITREWMKDGQLLSAGGNLIISEDKRVLSINPVKRTDSGEYLCRFSNLVSTADAKHILIVKSEDSLSPVLPAGALTGIVIGVLLVVGGAVSVAVFFIRKNGTNAEPMHQGGSQQLVYENTSPVYENTSHVYENTSPVYENTRQNQSPQP
uniref:Carcinoembryonic antigen-related cell adhesion molecule 1-like n=1 Tax=Salmo trutta TaxID=8032 RepID=A0A674BTD6_SALTR